ncbi:NACHT domain-containing protein [Verrucosispora sp. WMMD703]|uniref:NACHT domain-containing protein n=1 Tax=Verrucosispora sp. WMMD703 TaxID=3403463 RepID=UPI003B95081E
MPGIDLPDQRELPPGPLRDLTLTVRDLYEDAGRPSVRHIAERIAANDDLATTASHESIRSVLKGRRTRFEVLETIVRQLSLMANPPRDPSAAVAKAITFWKQTTATDAASAMIEEFPERGDGGDVLADIIEMSDEEAEVLVESFVQSDGGNDEPLGIYALLRDHPETLDVLTGDRKQVHEKDWVGLLMAATWIITPFLDTDDEYNDTRRNLVLGSIVPELAPRELDMSAFIADLGSGVHPIDALSRRFPTSGVALKHHYEPLYEGSSWSPIQESPVPALPFAGELKQRGDLLVAAASDRIEKARSRRTSVEANVAQQTEERYLEAVRSNRFDNARTALDVLTEQNPRRAQKVLLETGFVVLNDRDRSFLSGLWMQLAAANHAGTVIGQPRREVVSAVLKISGGNDLSSDATSSAPAPAPLGIAASEARRKANPAGADLLYTVFELSAEVHCAIKERVAGSKRHPLHRLEFRAVPRSSTTALCHVICFQRAGELTEAAVSFEVLRRDEQLAKEDVDHLVFVLLEGTVSDDVRTLTAAWTKRSKFTFGVHAIDSALTAEDVQQLRPQLRLPGRWNEYVRDPARLAFAGENHLELAATYDNQLPTRLLDERRTAVAGTALDYVARWLESDQRSLVLLGDFGDGKTFFTYNLARRLCEEGVAAPAQMRVPLRLALRSFSRTGGARELLRDRLEDMGMSIDEWHRLASSQPTLVILDGFDEMSTSLSPESIRANIRAAQECYQLFATSKVLLTSRSRAFGGPDDQRGLLERIGDPQLVHLRRFDRTEVISSLMRSAESQQQRVVRRLQNMHDPIGLATKPLYHAMIQEALPYLPERDFTEETLYETYIERTLERKLELLDDDQLSATPGAIMRNLLDILQRVAGELHRTNARYLYLRDFESGGLRGDGGPGIAAMLWSLREDTSPDDEHRQDATARIGIRSLLRGHSEGDPERWPVDFAHRSMREYFVARGVVNDIIADSDDPPALLRKADLSPEILRFAALILRARRSEEAQRALDRWSRSVTVHDRPSPLGANALSLLYAVDKKLPGRDYVGVRLDNVQLPGADLAGLNFRGSSLQGANLDNANLTGTDLTDADLTGVRLEETAAVTAILVDHDETIFAAYGDRTLRSWQIDTGRTTDRLLCQLPHPAERLWLTPAGRIAAVGDSTLTVLAPVGWATTLSFRLKSRYRGLHAAVEDALVLDESLNNGSLLSFRPDEGKAVMLGLPRARAWHVCAGGSWAVATPDRVSVHGPAAVSWPASQVSAITMRTDPVGETLVATGHEDGLVVVHQVIGGQAVARWKRQMHAGPVTAIAFLGADRLVTGGVDRGLCVTHTGGNSDDGEVARYELTLRCGGVKLKGVRGPDEQSRLRRLAKSSSARST